MLSCAILRKRLTYVRFSWRRDTNLHGKREHAAYDVDENIKGPTYLKLDQAQPRSKSQLANTKIFQELSQGRLAKSTV